MQLSSCDNNNDLYCMAFAYSGYAKAISCRDRGKTGKPSPLQAKELAKH